MKAPAHVMTYEDACGLQAYFDERRSASLAPPKADDEIVATNEKGQTIGEGTYRLRDPLARRRFAKLLRDEYSGIDPKLIKSVESGDTEVRVHVRWWDTGPVRRLRPDSDTIVVEASVGSVELPPNMCVSDLLFGDKVYEMRARYLRHEVDMATDKPPAP